MRPSRLALAALTLTAVAGVSAAWASSGRPVAHGSGGSSHGSHHDAHADHDDDRSDAVRDAATRGHDHGPTGHEGDEGLTLQPSRTESVSVDADGECDRAAPARRYQVEAIAVGITLNRYGDHDPEGRMYALAGTVDRIREAESAGAEGPSLGLQGDAIQPLVLRVNPGECLQVQLTNRLEEPASFHLHASSLVVADGGGAATAANPASLAAPGAVVEYAWPVPTDEPEGTRVFHSHGDPRDQSGHGLFGTLIVEPPGSTWHDPRSGDEGTVGWDAVVRPAGGEPFREFVLAYHEIGHEEYRLKAADGTNVPQVDPITSAYRPGARAINYRSEPFMNRLELQSELTGMADESTAYSSYTFGDPATPILRSYLGEAVKQRVVHGGGEVFHVHHVHGGSVRWRRQPGAGPADSPTGLTKHPDLLPGPSERIDSQGLGPSEAFDVDHECGSGGCQQGAGDHLVHCHVAHHYFAGMWGIWRVYNTLQDGPASTDAMAPLPAMSDGEGAPPTAVDSAGLAEEHRTALADRLPPPGTPEGYSASVWDWAVEDGRVVGEPETEHRWPGYESPRPGARPPVLFDPTTGAPAYPMLRPHLGARPPFAPDHGPAPFLDPGGPDGEPPPPGSNGPASLCPRGTRQRPVSLRAIKAPVPINERLRLTDPAGMIFVLAEDEDEVRADPSRRTPLAIRANAGEECLDVLLTSSLPDDGDNPFSKVSAHIHFVQFDVQAGDGVSTGFNYEQTVRPYTIDGRPLLSPVAAGGTDLHVADASRFPVGASVAIGAQDGPRLEIAQVEQVLGGDTIVLDRPLRGAHEAGAIVTDEFVRYRWYPDAQVGTAYFHDHVNGLHSWQHGLVGALVVEPPGATYHDPVTGEEIPSGPIADIRVPDRTPVSADVTGSFRELVSFVQDGSPLTRTGRTAGSNLNLRAEPLDRRPGPPDQAFSSTVHGDPATPLLRAYLGDPLVVRVTVGGTNEMHTWHLDGHWFRREPWSTESMVTSTARLGISERMDLVVPAAGGPQQRGGDYLYSNGRALKLREGSWGLLRVHEDETEDLAPLPGRPPLGGSSRPICPAAAPRRELSVVAIETALPMLGPRPGRIFALESHADAIETGDAAPEPLVLRVAVGDCLVIDLQNRLPAGGPPVGLHADGLAYDPADSAGVEVGHGPRQVVPVGERRTYTFFAHPEYGEGAAMLRDGGDLAGSGALGLYGAVVIGPSGVVYEPETGWLADAQAPDGERWRDVALFLHDEDDAIGSHRMPYTTNVRGTVGLNYGVDSTAPVIEAYAGDPVRISLLAPWSEQVQVFSLEGHQWPIEPRMTGSTRVGSTAIGGLEILTIVPVGGAGGDASLPGRYGFGNHREPYREAGVWSTLIVHDPCGEDVDDVARITARVGCGGDSSDDRPLVWMLAVAVVAGVALALWRQRSRLMPEPERELAGEPPA